MRGEKATLLNVIVFLDNKDTRDSEVWRHPSYGAMVLFWPPGQGVQARPLEFVLYSSLSPLHDIITALSNWGQFNLRL